VPVLSIENSLQGNTVLMLYFRYGDVDFAYKSDIERHVGLRKNTAKYFFDIIHRNHEFENGIPDWLVDNGLVYLLGASFQTLQIHLAAKTSIAGEAMYCAINFINDNSELLKAKGFNIDNVLSRDFFIGRIELFQQFSEDNDWFDLKIYVMFDDIRIPFSALRKNILENNRELVLPDGRIAILPSGWFSKFHDLALISKPEGEKVQVKKSQFSYIQNLIEGNNRVEQFIEASGKGDFPIVDLPNNMLRQLRPYQQRGMSWFMFLHENNFGGCLSDDMGLGKTIQVLAFLLKIKQQNQIRIESGQLNLFNNENGAGKTSLIVMPLSLVHNWKNEIRNTTPDLKVLNHTGLGRRFDANLFKRYDLVLTTYGTVRNDIEKLKKFPFRFVFLDESQYIKNPESKIFAAVSQLASEQRFVITGTPVENSLIDLWSQLQFVNPGLLGDLKFFRDRFYQPIEKRGSKSSEKRFRQIINPFILRRTKNEVAKDLPSLTEKIHFCPMTDEQSEIYDDYFIGTYAPALNCKPPIDSRKRLYWRLWQIRSGNSEYSQSARRRT
jgi:SNF2 family DNA or RNA helicase